MSGAEDRRGSGEESGERAKESGERAKSSRKKEKEKTAEKEKSKETEKGKNKENETDQCKAGEKVTTGEDGQPAGGSNNANNRRSQCFRSIPGKLTFASVTFAVVIMTLLLPRNGS